MGHHLELVLTLTGALTAAWALGLVTHSLRMSPIVGYLLAGVVVGPFTPGFVAHGPIAEQLAEVGVILLMFGVGLHFHVRDLMAVRRIAIPGALCQIAVATGCGVLVTQAAGWSISAGLVFGLAISVASTVVLLRVLSDHGALHTPSGHIAVGWLIVEDVFTVLVLIVLPMVVGADKGSGFEAVAQSIGRALLSLAVLVVCIFVIGQRVVPRLLAYVARTRSRELFTLTVLVLALGIAVGAAELFGASMALGAFLAGMVVSQSDFSAQAASEALPMRDAFAVLFFVSIGMLLDPASLMADLHLTLLTLLVVLVAKPLAALAVVLALKKPLRTALVVAVSLAQIGEFSFILAALARRLELLPERATNILVFAAIVSITLNPLLFAALDPLLRRFSQRAAGVPRAEVDERAGEPSHRVITIGYGPVGRTLTRLLRENGFTPVVVELNYETVHALKAEGIDAIYGDASRPDILREAGVERAGSLIFAASGTPPEAVIQVARALNPHILVLARASYVSEAETLASRGANVVVAAEAEVALAMAERLLAGFGATPEQLDRERHRVRAELTLAAHGPAR